MYNILAQNVYACTWCLYLVFGAFTWCLFRRRPRSRRPSRRRPSSVRPSRRRRLRPLSVRPVVHPVVFHPLSVRLVVCPKGNLEKKISF